MKKGTITGIRGSWGSGIITLDIKNSTTGKTEQVHGDNGPTVRALAAAFPDVIEEGHRVNPRAVIGQEIFYELTDWGTLAGFVPVDEESEEKLAEAGIEIE